jgi:hypothetical protein
MWSHPAEHRISLFVVVALSLYTEKELKPLNTLRNLAVLRGVET